jgi:hypothetical protein
LAELFIQLETKKGTGTKIPVLGQELYEDLKLLLSIANDDNVKCACQVLKVINCNSRFAVLGLTTLLNLARGNALRAGS